jgi:transcriptional regulator with XRE-family HTH domain
MKERTKRRPGRPKGSKNVTVDEIKGFGQRLKVLREKRGLTQQQLAEATKTDWTQISRYERDVNLPTADRVVALARVLRVSPNALLLGTRGEEKIEFNNIRLYERFRALDKLPKDEQELALQILDGVIAKYELAHLADRVKRPA